VATFRETHIDDYKHNLTKSNPNWKNTSKGYKFFFFKKKITFDESRKLVQERTDLVLVDIPNSGKPTNQQHTSQKGTLNRSVTLQVQPTLLIIFSSLITTAAAFFALGIAKEPPQALWSSTRSCSILLLLGLFQRRAGSEEVESLVGSEAEEE